MVDNSPGGLQPAATTDRLFSGSKLRTESPVLSLCSSDDPLCCRVQLNEVFHVGFPVEASLIWKRHETHDEVFAAARKVCTLISTVVKAQCARFMVSLGLTNVAPNLKETQLFLLHGQ